MAKQNKSKPAIKTHWGEVAGWYDQLVGESGSEYHREVVLPGVMRLIDPEPGQKIIDIACGQGVLCRLLQHRRLRKLPAWMGRKVSSKRRASVGRRRFDTTSATPES